LFVLLNEGKLDFFVSATSTNLPVPGRSGLAYSTPYFYDGGIGGIAARLEVRERVQAQLHEQSTKPYEPGALRQALTGLTVAVQEGTSAQFYAEAHLPSVKLVLCDSLPAAFESQDPPIDVILGRQPVLQHIATLVRKSWQPLMADGKRPLVLTREHYAVVMAEENYALRRFVNDVLFRLHESGRLTEMRRRWFEDTYAYPRRAATEGLPFAAENMAQHYDQGTCRWRSRP
jgi:ABC-type amino acid transport substrate-binding protein